MPEYTRENRLCKKDPLVHRAGLNRPTKMQLMKWQTQTRQLMSLVYVGNVKTMENEEEAEMFLRVSTELV